MFRKNEIIRFLEGTWYCKNITVIPNEKVITSEYKEKMVASKKDTLTITAYGIHEGKDLTKDMIIELKKNEVLLKQDDFVSTGRFENQVVTLVNENYLGSKYIHRMYLMEDKYVFQMDVIKDGQVVRNQMSYLERM